MNLSPAKGKVKRLSPDDVRIEVEAHLRRQQDKLDAQADRMTQAIFKSLNVGSFRIKGDGRVSVRVWAFGCHCDDELTCNLQIAGYDDIDIDCDMAIFFWWVTMRPRNSA